MGIAKSTIPSDQALKRSTDEMNQARELCDALGADELQMASLKELIKKSRDFLEVASNLSEENREIQGAMQQLLEEIRALADEKLPGQHLDAFAKWLSKQWCPSETSTPNFTFTDFSDIKDIIPFLNLRGWCCASDGMVGLMLILLPTLTTVGPRNHQAPAVIFPSME